MTTDVVSVETTDAKRAAAMARAARGELLDSDDMRTIWKMSKTAFAKYLRLGAFDVFRARPTIGDPRFLGVLVQKFLNGDPLYVPTFGAKRSAR